MDSTPLQARFRLILELIDEDDRSVRTDVVKAVLTFNLNQIPSATCQLPLGRLAADGRTLAMVHQNPALFRAFSRAKLWLHASGRYSEVSEWPDKEVLIFDGYVVGFTASVGQSATFEVWLTDAAFDLQTNSAVSGAFYPGHLVDYAFSTIFDQGITGVDATTMIPGAGLANKIIVNFQVTRDVWTDLLKPICYAVALNDNQQIKSELFLCLGGKEVIQHRADRAIAQLRRIEGEARGLDLPFQDTKRSSFNPGCVIVESDSFSSLLDNISSAVTSIAVSELAAGTIWERLIMTLLPAFELQFVPRVKSHLVVPSNPALRQYWPKKILARDYEMLSPTFRVPHAISRVVVTSQIGSRTGLTPDVGQPVTDGWVCYSPPGAGTVERGAILMVDPPIWLQGVSVYSPAETGADLGKPPAAAQTPPKQVSQIQQAQTQSDFIVSAEKLYRAYAQSVYYREFLRHRSVAVAGKLRFDIAPGNIVFIEVPASRMLETQDRPSNLVGMVYGVTIAINAESGQAGTGFSIGFVRTEEENSRDTVTSTSHPLYQSPYVGAPLIEDYWFSEESD